MKNSAIGGHDELVGSTLSRAGRPSWHR